MVLVENLIEESEKISCRKWNWNRNWKWTTTMSINTYNRNILEILIPEYLDDLCDSRAEWSIWPQSYMKNYRQIKKLRMVWRGIYILWLKHYTDWTGNIYYISLHIPVVVMYLFNLSTPEAEVAEFCEFKFSLVHVVSFRITRPL